MEARFADTATAPGDPVHVLIDRFDGGQQRHGPVVWMPRPGSIYPAAGEIAYVQQADDGRWTVVAWETGRVGSETGGGESGPTAPPSFVSLAKWGVD